jgi:rubrerythrin
MTYQDILIVAMKREEASKNLYTDLAARLESREAQQVFQRLAQEEASHKLKFEKLYDEQVLKDN